MEIKTERPGAGDAGPRGSHGRAEGLTSASDTTTADPAQRARLQVERLPGWVQRLVEVSARGDVDARRRHVWATTRALRDHGLSVDAVLALAALDAPFARRVPDASAEIERACSVVDALGPSTGGDLGHEGSGALTISRCMADVTMEAVRWAWPLRFALGKLGLVAGVPGLGKSQLAAAMIATVTTGGRWPDGTRAPLGSAIMIACEDDAGDTIGPRLKAAGADLARVHVLDWVRRVRAGGDDREHYDVRRHGSALADLIARIGDVRLIVIDPITAYLGRADSHVAAEVRGALAPLQSLAAESGVAVVLISHLTKGGGDGSAMARVAGSGAFVAVCRSAWLIAPDPSDSAGERRIMAPIKNNLAAAGSALAFTIESITLQDDIATSRVAFDAQPVQITADELLQQATPGAQATHSALGEAIAFLRAELADGPKVARDVEDAGKAAGVSKGTLVRARRTLGVRARKRGGSGPWELSLPPSAQEDGGDG